MPLIDLPLIDLRLDDLQKPTLFNNLKEQQCLLRRRYLSGPPFLSEPTTRSWYKPETDAAIGECSLIAVKDVTKEKEERENELESFALRAELS
jgi:hypothetical protein